MKTRLLGAAVLIALAVLFVPMFFSGKPPAAGDQTLNLAIPQAPDRELQTRTMSLNPDGAPAAQASSAAHPFAPVAPGAASDQLATVNIGSRRPRDVETDPLAAKPPVATTVTTGSGASPTQPVIPMQGAAAPKPPAGIKPAPVETAPPAAAKAVVKPAPVVPAAAVAAVSAAPVEHGSYVLNLSAYASAANAASLQRRVQALGYAASSRQITQAGKQLTQVTAGPFATRTATEAARLKISQSVPGVQPHVELTDAVNQTAIAPAKPAMTANAPSRVTSAANGWAVQVAALGSQADANALRDKLRSAGFDGYISSVQSAGKQLWQVRAGPQTQRADAQRVQEQIKSKLGIDGVVRQVP